MLVLDNCSAHPDAQDLISDDWKVVGKFIPVNVPVLIQPMDQSVLNSLKLRYKKKLLLEDERGKSVVDFLKSVNMKK